MSLFRRKRKGCEPESVSSQTDGAEARAALERAKHAKEQAEKDLEEMRAHANRSKEQRVANHFAPTIYAVLSSRRGER